MNQYSEDILKNPTLLPAVMNLACVHCRYVDNELDISRTRVCPHCGKSGTRVLYRKYNVQHFLELIQRLYTKNEPEAIVLVACAMLERLLEDLLIEMMEKHNLDDDAIDRKLKDFWRLDERAKKLFKAYSGKTLAQELSPAKGFWKIWKELRYKRDEFIHGRASVIIPSDGRKGFELALNAEHIFSQIHNKYAC